MVNGRAKPRCFKWPYQAKVMKTFEPSSMTHGAMRAQDDPGIAKIPPAQVTAPG
jgi:hypothetical protein